MPIPLGILAVAGAGAGGGGAFDLLETTVLSSNTASVTFSSLGSYTDYKHLQLRIVMRTTVSDVASTVKLNFNSDTGNNYSIHQLLGTGSSVLSSAGASNPYIVLRASGNTETSNSFAPNIVDILDFSNSNKNTTTRSLQAFPGASVSQIVLNSGAWYNTNAVTSITIAPADASNLLAGSRFSLYGIK